MAECRMCLVNAHPETSLPGRSAIALLSRAARKGFGNALVRLSSRIGRDSCPSGCPGLKHFTRAARRKANREANWAEQRQPPRTGIERAVNCRELLGSSNGGRQSGQKEAPNHFDEWMVGAHPSEGPCKPAPIGRFPGACLPSGSGLNL